MQQIPVRTPIERAHQVLESEGFDVIKQIDEPFQGGKKANYLDGERIDGLIFVRVWRVFVFFESNAVVKVVVEMREVGP
ncbi:MAG: hypothetical protein KME10_26535 [Plectolyngbya sp. WJT66-NPBG17]|nr:hypothetical protein [Plectolyngbya sp. WJT66-NPBG17]